MRASRRAARRRANPAPPTHWLEWVTRAPVRLLGRRALLTDLMWADVRAPVAASGRWDAPLHAPLYALQREGRGRPVLFHEGVLACDPEEGWSHGTVSWRWGIEPTRAELDAFAVLHPTDAARARPVIEQMLARWAELER